jgi:D-serine dehydratase
MAAYTAAHRLPAADAVHVAWATGGRLVPPEQRELFFATHLE